MVFVIRKESGLWFLGKYFEKGFYLSQRFSKRFSTRFKKEVNVTIVVLKLKLKHLFCMCKCVYVLKKKITVISPLNKEGFKVKVK